MVVDMFLTFRLAALPHTLSHAQAWQLEVMTIEQVAAVLESLGFLDAETAQKLADASTTLVPQPGLDTIRLTTMADLVEIVSPFEDPPSAEAQDGYMLIVKGETTEEVLANAGFVAKVPSNVGRNNGWESSSQTVGAAQCKPIYVPAMIAETTDAAARMSSSPVA
jgi:hypothetical protein